MKKALMSYGGWEGHEPKACVEKVARALESRGFEADVADTLDIFLDAEKMAKADVIIPCWTMGEITPEQRQALADTVAAGAGLAGWHGGMGDAFRADPDYQFMCGGQFVSHPGGIKPYSVQITAPQDPVMEGIQDFSIESEQYYMHVDPGNEVLAETTFKTPDMPWINGTVMPVVWKRDWGKGRVFYSALGHCAEEFDIPELMEITLRGIAWAARD